MKKYKEARKKANKIFKVSDTEDLILKEKELTVFPVSFNFIIFAEAIHFEEMERTVLKNIPDSFTQDMLELFKDTPFESNFLYSSLVRTSDFLYDINDVDGVGIANLLQKCIRIDDFGVVGKEKVIPYATLKLHY